MNSASETEKLATARMPVRAPVVRTPGLRCVLDDGVVLVADVWTPDGAGRWPVLLQRLPYGRSVASTPVLPHPTWLARHGYAVVVQDCRGRGDSSGTFSPFVHEGPDGVAAIEWAAHQPFCDGRVATYGFSYQGLAQLYAAALRPPSLQAIAPMMCCADPYEGWTYEGGLLRWPFVCLWAAQLAGQGARTGPLPFDLGTLPISAALGSDPPPWFSEWLAHPNSDEYWAARRPDLDAIEVPAFTVGGWFDDFSSGSAELSRRLRAETFFGPWAHMPWGTTHGGLDSGLGAVELGPDASPAPVWKGLVQFFDGVFGRTTTPTPTVRYHLIGGGWRQSPAWPPAATTTRLYGTSAGGNANSRWGDGVLGTADAPDVSSVLVVEPHVPHPGPAPAFQDESTAHDRRDVLCYTSAPSPTDFTVAGAPVVRLVTICDRPSHDVVVTLSLVDVAGSARVVTASACRVRDDSALGLAHRWDFALRPIAFRVLAGARLRLAISGARFPCYDRNPHTTHHDPSTPANEHVVATIEVSGVQLDLPTLDDRPSSADD